MTKITSRQTDPATGDELFVALTKDCAGALLADPISADATTAEAMAAIGLAIAAAETLERDFGDGIPASARELLRIATAARRRAYPKVKDASVRKVPSVYESRLLVGETFPVALASELPGPVATALDCLCHGTPFADLLDAIGEAHQRFADEMAAQVNSIPVNHLDQLAQEYHPDALAQSKASHRLVSARPVDPEAPLVNPRQVPRTHRPLSALERADAAGTVVRA